MKWIGVAHLSVSLSNIYHKYKDTHVSHHDNNLWQEYIFSNVFSFVLFNSFNSISGQVVHLELFPP